MADVQPAVDVPAPPAQAGVGASFFGVTKSLISRALIIYFISSFFRRPTPTPGQGDPAGGVARIAATNLYSDNAEFDLYAFISENEHFRNFTKDSDSIVWYKEGLRYGDWYGGPQGDGTYSISTQIQVSPSLQNNGSFYLHVAVVESGEDLESPRKIVRFKRLNKFRKVKYGKTKNLLTGERSASLEIQQKAETIKEEILSHWHPNISINVIVDQTAWTPGAVPVPLNEYIDFLPNGLQYKPILFVNDYWNLVKDYQPFNETVKSIDLQITFQPLTMFKWQLYAAQDMRGKMMNGPMGFATMLTGESEDDADQDSLKEAMLDTNPILLGMTIVVSLAHSIFEFLAFKNDIQFWKSRESLEGLSVKSVLFNVIQSLIVLLYVLDNDTNILIRLSCFVGLGIEMWKVKKVLNVSLDRENRIFGFPKLIVSDKSTYVASQTKQYDDMAFRYLSKALYPLLACYAVYSLIYEEHRGWYSWVLGMLYSFLLTFGFIMMTPQLFINYKMKSVAHLPWRMMTYKALNTFIDDIFAFVIKMPTMYRLGCFRDDIVFFIFLYQRWAYRVDLKRVNEFGFSGEMADQVKSQANGETPVDGSQPKPIEEKKKD